MSKAFISYSSEDRKAAVILAEVLRQRTRITPQFIGPENYPEGDFKQDLLFIEIGDEFIPKIIEAIRTCQFIVLIWSKYAKDSGWVFYELGMGEQMRKKIVPICIDSTPVPKFTETIQHTSIYFHDEDRDDLALYGPKKSEPLYKKAELEKLFNAYNWKMYGKTDDTSAPGMNNPFDGLLDRERPEKGGFEREELKQAINQLIWLIYPKESRFAFGHEVESWMMHLFELKNDENASEQLKHETDIALKIIAELYNRNKPPRVFGLNGNESSFPHRYWGLLDILEGSRKNTWISWDSIDNKLVLVKEAPELEFSSFGMGLSERSRVLNMQNQHRIKWERLILISLNGLKHKDAKRDRVIKTNERADKFANSNWFSMPFHTLGDLELQLFSGRHRGEAHINTFLEEDIFQYTFHNRIENTSARDINSTEDWQKLKGFLLKVLNIIRDMHHRNVYHLDIQPSNILIKEINGDIDPVFCDFDRALEPRFFSEELLDGVNNSKEIYNTLRKIEGRSLGDAPERFKGNKEFDIHTTKEDILEKCDVYSFTCMMASILLHMPHIFDEILQKKDTNKDRAQNGNESTTKYDEHQRRHEKLLGDIKKDELIPSAVKRLLEDGLCYSYKERATIDELDTRLKEIINWKPIQEREDRRKKREARRIIKTVLIALSIAFIIYAASGLPDSFFYKVYDGGIYTSEEFQEQRFLGFPQPPLIKGDMFILDELQIPPGMTVYMDQRASLTITKNAKIVANGSAGNEIRFTAKKEYNIFALFSRKEPDELAGYWGGITICGLAYPDSLGLEFFDFDRTEVDTSEYSIEEWNAFASFGSDSLSFIGPLENSGVFKHVLIEYAGYNFGRRGVDSRSAFNSLSLAGVASGTEIDHVWIRESGDDGIELYGSTVDLSHIVIERVDDDALDFELPFNHHGTISNLNIFVDTGNPELLGDGGSTAIEAPSEDNSTLIDINISNGLFELLLSDKEWIGIDELNIATINGLVLTNSEVRVSKLYDSTHVFLITGNTEQGLVDISNSMLYSAEDYPDWITDNWSKNIVNESRHIRREQSEN